MTLDHALRLLAMLTDTVSEQQQRINDLEAQLAAAIGTPSGDG